MTELVQRVLAFDASALIERGLTAGVLKPTVRYQAYVTANDLFDQPPGRCTCGCGQELTGRRWRWATDTCGSFGSTVTEIIKGTADTIRLYLEHKYGAACAHCGVMDEPLQVDHILPVHKGGGGRWLDNYQLLCADCHKIKTAHDRRHP